MTPSQTATTGVAEDRERVHRLAAGLQGWAKQRQNPDNDNPPPILDLKAVSLFQGWQYLRVKIPRVGVDYHKVVAPFHRDGGMPQAWPVGFSGTYLEVLAFLEEQWLPAFTATLDPPPKPKHNTRPGY